MPKTSTSNVVDFSSGKSGLYETEDLRDRGEGTAFSGGSGGGMEPGLSMKDYTDSKIAELRADSRADLIEIKSMIEAKLDNVPTTVQFWGGLAGSVVTIIGLVFAILAYSSDKAENASSRSAELSSTLTKIESRLGSIESSQRDVRSKGPTEEQLND